MKNKNILLIFFGIFVFANISYISAHCPLCTAGAAGGIAAARFLGVDDSIVGLFLGAFITSTALWFNKWLVKKNLKFQVPEFMLIILSFLLLVIPLYTAGIITDFEMVRSMPEHHSILGMGIYGVDKILFGTMVGTIFTWIAFTFSDSIKRKKGRVLYPYQSISFMIIITLVLSLIFWIITK